MTLAALSTRLLHWPTVPPEKLAALGPLLCLHASCDPHLLSGWTRATASFAWATLDSHGPCEGICFVDADGACCWQLQRLPDSDFLGWDRLLASLPSAQPAVGKRSAWTRHWPACAPARWRGGAVQLLALPDTSGTARLAATDVTLSGMGEDCALRLARRAGAVM